MWVINRVHYNTANGRTNTTPAVSTSFTDFFQALFFVTNFTDSCTAIYANFAHFTRTQTNLCVSTFFCKQYRRSTSRTCNLCTFTWFHFDTVNSCTNRNIADRQSVTYFDSSFSTGNQYCTGLNTTRSNDVATLTICIAQQRDKCSTVRVIFDTLYFCRDTVFVTFKIYDAVMMFMTTTFMTGSDMTIVVTTGSRIFLFQQRCIRCTFVQTFCYHANHAATACRGRLHFNDCHFVYSLSAAAAAASKSNS